MKSKEKIINFHYTEILSFIIPIIIVILAYIGVQVYPGGDNMIMTYDLRSQVIALYGYLYNHGAGYDNMMHSMSGALGGGFFGSFAYYYTPLDIVYCFVPTKYLPDAIYFLSLFKFGLAGLTCSIYLINIKQVKIPNYMIIAFSCCYSLMSYDFMYCMMLMWIDAVILLPLLAMNLEKILSNGRSKAFVLLMTLCIICNYYTAYMNVIALILYFFFRMIEDGIDRKVLFARLWSFSIHGIIGAGMAGFMIIPVLLDYTRGKLSQGSVGIQGAWIKNSLPDVLHGFISQSYAGLGYNATPNIFCGSIVLILAICWLVLVNKNFKAKIAGFLIILVYFISFMFGPLDRVWHGFREPVCFSVRYAYTFVFFLIIFAVRGLRSLSRSAFKISKNLAKLVVCITLVFTFIELYINGSYIISRISTESGYTYSKEYYRNCKIAENIIPYDLLSNADAYGRLITNYNYSYFDSALFGYDGVARYSSSYNHDISEFFRDLGMGAADATINEVGITPPVSGLFDVRYIASFVLDKSDLYVPLREYNGAVLYEDVNAFPLVFETKYKGIICEQFSSDPFKNINTLYSELFDVQYRDNVFKEVGMIQLDSYDFERIDKYLSTETVYFNTENRGHYYVFVDYMTDEDETKSTVTRDLYFDGKYIGTYGNNIYTNCVDLGELGDEEGHCVTFASSAAQVGKYYIYYMDFDNYKKISSNTNGFELDEIGKKGIILNGTVTDDVNLLVSLPYEKGYTVYVDGIKTNLISYRDCLMMIPVSKGEHTIEIKYSPPGIYMGIVLSIISFILFELYFRMIIRKKA